MLALTLTAELNGLLELKYKLPGRVTDLKPRDDADSPFYYTFKVQCTSCRETHPNWVGVSRYESNEMTGSRGEANFVWRCKNCKREHTATIKAPPFAYTQASPPTRQKIIEIDCRGLDFVDFKADPRPIKGEFEASASASTTKFTGIDLSEGEWSDYDEKVSEEVSVTNCQWEVRRA